MQRRWGDGFRKMEKRKGSWWVMHLNASVLLKEQAVELVNMPTQGPGTGATTIIGQQS
jgi:hypothetical protein